MAQQDFRGRIEAFVAANAKPPDKFSHQARLYHLASVLAGARNYDDDVLHAAAWMHDLGVFVGHRPEDPKALASWDNVAYAIKQTPAILESLGFPREKIPAVLECIRTHLPSSEPTSWEGTALRDADILEQLGAVAILRTISKTGRDTRFIRFGDCLKVLKRNLAELPQLLKLDLAKNMAEPRIATLRAFIEAAESEAAEIPW
jgi:uncharacterized protein